MSSETPPASAKPRSKDHAIWDVVCAFFGAPALLVAHDLKLFTLLGEKPLTLAEACAALATPERSTEVLLQMNVAFGFVDMRDGRYGLTPVAAEYLDEKSPVSLAGYLDFAVAHHKLWSMESLKKAVLTNSPQVGGTDLFSTPEAQKTFAKDFTKAMYAHSIGSALEWPEQVDLSKHRMLLDIGGGSGAQTVGVLLRWPNLRGTVLDTPPVIAETPGYVGRYNLGDRIDLRVGDMWTDPFPQADVHLYGDIFHDWPKERGEFLARKSFAALPPGGKIILREVLFDDDKRGPVAAAAYGVNMLLVTLGGQYSKGEMDSLLRQVGSRDVTIRPPGAGYRSLVIAQKQS